MGEDSLMFLVRPECRRLESAGVYLCVVLPSSPPFPRWTTMEALPDSKARGGVEAFTLDVK